MTRRSILRTLTLGMAGAILAAGALFDMALAHHGWGWATDKQFTLTGTITDKRLGNPHGEVTLDVEGERWVVEIGQPWRNERAGLSDSVLADGTAMTAHGHRSNNPDENLMKAERVVIDGKDYVLYPNRDS